MANLKASPLGLAGAAALLTGILALAGCGDGDGGRVADCSALPGDWTVFRSVSDPGGTGIRHKSDGGTLALRFDTLRLSGTEAALAVDVHVPDGCALDLVNATVHGTARLPSGTTARLVADLDGRSIIYDWDGTPGGAFEVPLEADYQPGYVDPPAAPADVAGPGETAYRLPLTLRAQVYGDQPQDSAITVGRIELAVQVQAGPDGTE